MRRDCTSYLWKNLRDVRSLGWDAESIDGVLGMVKLQDWLDCLLCETFVAFGGGEGNCTIRYWAFGHCKSNCKIDARSGRNRGYQF
jgi:hypothetical protein